MYRLIQSLETIAVLERDGVVEIESGSVEHVAVEALRAELAAAGAVQEQVSDRFAYSEIGGLADEGFRRLLERKIRENRAGAEVVLDGETELAVFRGLLPALAAGEKGDRQTR